MSERELPQGWAWATVGELAGSTGLFCDGDWVESKDQDPNGEVRLLQLADVGDGEFLDRSNRHLTKQRAIELRCTFLAPGDLMISRMADPIGRTCMYPGLTTPAVTVVDVAILRPHEGIDPSWLMRAINSPVFRALTIAAASGTTRSRVSRTNLGELAIPVPPLSEQRRIVAKLDELLARSRRAREALAEVPALVARYRESVLAAAFRGDLTADWREAHPDAEPASAEQRGLPNSWRSTRLEDLTDMITSGSRGWSGYQSEQGARFIRVGDLRRNDLTVDIESAIFVDPPHTAEGTRTQVRRGDIVISITADVGMVGVLRDDPGEAYVNQHVALCRPKRPEESVYLGYALLDPINVQSSMRNAQYGATKASLSLKQVREFVVPLAPLAEQREIVRRVETAFARIDAVEAAVAEQRARLDAYDRSLLARAFAGELVPQDPADEPAAALLARLRAARGEAPARGRRAKGKG